MKFSYVTVITTDHYLKGALVLHESLLRAKARFGLLAVLTANISETTERILNRFNVETRRVIRNIDIPEAVKSLNKTSGTSHWNNTFAKLLIFDLIDFDKLVYLDSDLLLLNNIDILFNKPHMSAVVAGKSFPGNAHWKELNSGLIVVEPQSGLVDRFVDALPEVARKRKNMGDQDVLQVYYKDWCKTEELELDEQYNIFQRYIDHYIKRVGYSFTGPGKRISVIHFIGATKPWMRTWRQEVRYLLSLAAKLKIYEIKAHLIYVALLTKINVQLFAKRLFVEKK